MTPDAVIAALEGANDLRTADYRLRPVCDADLDDLFVHFGDPRVAEFLDNPPVETRDQAFDIIDWACGVRAAGSGVRWTIRDADDAFLGTCGFHLMNYSHGRRSDIGYDLGPGHWRRGVMAQVLPAMLAFGFGALDLHRIQAMVTPGNERSCRLLVRHGFAREGVLRDFGYWRGRYWDQIQFARLRTDVQGSSDTE
ncbi:MAG: GNAT family protein [Caulobacteraceae bacterium]|nr:GNAT family protein [Caulobacteraceae bacterium]